MGHELEYDRARQGDTTNMQGLQDSKKQDNMILRSAWESSPERNEEAEDFQHELSAPWQTSCLAKDSDHTEQENLSSQDVEFEEGWMGQPVAYRPLSSYHASQFKYCTGINVAHVKIGENKKLPLHGKRGVAIRGKCIEVAPGLLCDDRLIYHELSHIAQFLNFSRSNSSIKNIEKESENVSLSICSGKKSPVNLRSCNNFLFQDHTSETDSDTRISLSPGTRGVVFLSEMYGVNFDLKEYDERTKQSIAGFLIAESELNHELVAACMRVLSNGPSGLPVEPEAHRDMLINWQRYVIKLAKQINKREISNIKQFYMKLYDDEWRTIRSSGSLNDYADDKCAQVVPASPPLQSVPLVRPSLHLDQSFRDEEICFQQEYYLIKDVQTGVFKEVPSDIAECSTDQLTDPGLGEAGPADGSRRGVNICSELAAKMCSSYNDQERYSTIILIEPPEGCKSLPYYEHHRSSGHPRGYSHHAIIELPDGRILDPLDDTIEKNYKEYIRVHFFKEPKNQRVKCIVRESDEDVIDMSIAPPDPLLLPVCRDIPDSLLSR